MKKILLIIAMIAGVNLTFMACADEPVLEDTASAISAAETADTGANDAGNDAGTAGGSPETADTAAPPAGEESASGRPEDIPAAEAEQVVVYVCGAVVSPGVYTLEADARVYEAVEAAGGFAADADRDYVNQAEKLSDGVQLIIPTAAETKSRGEAGSGTAAPAAYGIVTGSAADSGSTAGIAAAGSDTAHGIININTANAGELEQIPGIGQSKAQAIVRYREEHGPFRSPEDIMNVPGIKAGSFAKMQGAITTQ